jgi:hypothetical protein
VSKHVSLTLHAPEEQISFSIADSLKQVPVGKKLNPIADYFDATSRLKGKILSNSSAEDAELLGLMIVGVVSSAEFYFRSMLGQCILICPLCIRHSEMAQVPIGSIEYYRRSDYCFVLGAMEHESLADAKKLASYIERFTGFQTGKDSSVTVALDGYDDLCEVRHCLAHARGFLSLKGSRALKLQERDFSKVLVSQDGALNLLKLSHNCVRAVNRFVFNSLVNRWIENDVLTGSWLLDRDLFKSAWYAFCVNGEDSFNGMVQTAYRPVQKVITRRRQGIAAKA